MRVLTIDCSEMRSEQQFWSAYLAAAGSDSEGYFGANLDAFWDALNGGPGWPGECEIRFIKTDPLRLWRDGLFYKALAEIAAESKVVGVYVE